MNNSDVFRKSDIGRQEIKNQSLGVLPREARTLLIMIDGKKTYQNYIDSLNTSKMFAEFGGVAPLLELLLDFQCIETVNAVSQVPSSTIDKPAVGQPQEQPLSFIEDVKTLEHQSSGVSREAEFDFALNKQEPKADSMSGGFFKRNAPNVNYETLKSELATYIEKNAPSGEAWGYLLNLEQCHDTQQLLTLTQDIQSTTEGSLSRDMSEFSKKIKRQL